MLPAYSNIAFIDAARAEANLARIGERLPAPLRQALPALLAQTPAPDDAVNFLERFLRPEAAPQGVLAFLAAHPASLHYLLTVFSYSRFLSETILQQPSLLTTLLRPPRPGDGPAHGPRGLERARTREDLDDEFARFSATSLDVSPAVLLARFKRREYLRIMLRDVLKLATLAEVTLELSSLADLLLEQALLANARSLSASYGHPQHTDPAGRRRASELAVLALGKLGGQELNYNSDIDLMFLYSADGETSGGTAGAIANREYFVRLAQGLLRMITENTPEGAVYRVDLRLRPQGGEGELVVSRAAAFDYYRTRAREWELQSLIRARGAAGDRDTARRFLNEVRPLVYQREFRLEVVEAVLNAREQITRTLTRRQARRAAARALSARAGRPSPPAAESAADTGAINVKLSPGGIRDIEFLAQCLQRLYGGEDTWLQAAPTLVALQRLHDKGHLSGRDFQRLAAAYQFLRTVEHRLQLRDGLQRHQIPEAAGSLDRLARRCGVEPPPGAPAPHSPGATLLARLSEHLEFVREIYNRLLLRERSEAAAPRPRAPAIEDASGPALLRRVEEEFPAVGALASELTAGLESAHYLRRGLVRYLTSALLSPATMARLEADPAPLREAAALFDRSDLAVDLLSHHPEEIEQVALRSGSAHQPMLPFARTPAQRAEDLRCAYRLALLREISAQLLGSSEDPAAAPFPFLARLTALAEQALQDALDLAVQECFGSSVRLEEGPFAVFALGRMGSCEMSVGSDADLLFLVDGALPVAEREKWGRVAERLVQILSSHTREGVIFAVDTRLRPRGSEGELLPTVETFEKYFSSEAAAWEALTMLKLRAVGGNVDFGGHFSQCVRSKCAERFGGPPDGPSSASFAADLSRVRARLEQDALAPRDRGRFKKMAGGFYDLEYIIGYLTLVRGVSPPGGNILLQIRALEEAGVLDTATIDALRSTAILYRAADHAARLITGRPLRGWPEPALAERMERLLRQWEMAWQGGLRALLEERGRELHAIYLRVLA